MKQASGQTMRPQCSQDWDSRRPTIEKLYRIQERDLSEANLKRWGLSTRVKSGKMRTTVRVQRRRRAHGKEARSSLHNRKAVARMVGRLLKTEDPSLALFPSFDTVTASPPSSVGSTPPEVADRPSVAATNMPLIPAKTTSLTGENTRQIEPLAANHWADMLVSSIHELRSVYDRLQAPPQRLPSFLTAIDFEDKDLASHYDPTALYSQTMQHVAG